MGAILYYLSLKAWYSGYNYADATARARTGSSKPQGPGLLQDVVRTTGKKKACASWSQCFISYNRNDKLVIGREATYSQFSSLITCQGSVCYRLGDSRIQAHQSSAGPGKVRVRVFSLS